MQLKTCLKILNELEQYLLSNPDDEIYIGRIIYQETSKIEGAISKNPIFSKSGFSLNDQESLIKLLLLKRNAFKYEDELRIFIVKPIPCSSKGIPFYYKCSPTDLVESVILHPNFSNSEIESRLSQDTENGGYGFTSFRNSRGIMQKRICKSRLYNFEHPSFINI